MFEFKVKLNIIHTPFLNLKRLLAGIIDAADRSVLPLLYVVLVLLETHQRHEDIMCFLFVVSVFLMTQNTCAMFRKHHHLKIFIFIPNRF